MANEDHGHVALPKLYGAPAYARPPVAPVARTERPLDPDDLPLENEQTEEERQLAQGLATGARDADASDQLVTAAQGKGGRVNGRSFGLRAIAGRIRGQAGARVNG